MDHHNALQNQEGMSYFKELLCMAEQVCLPKGRFGQYIMQIHKASRGQREGRGTFLCLNFSSFAIKYEFHVTVVRRHINSYQSVISMREVQGSFRDTCPLIQTGWTVVYSGSRKHERYIRQ